MTRFFLQKCIVAMLLLSFAAAPFSGAVCTMSCADTNGVCCCTSSGIPGELSYEKPSCCQPEVSDGAESDAVAERIAGNGRTVMPAFPFASAGEGVALPSTEVSTDRSLSAGPDSSRSSPAYLLNATFLI